MKIWQVRKTGISIDELEMYNLLSISIIIPTYNEERNIERCLSAIFSQDYPKELLEIIIVDNYSEDKIVELAQKYNTKIYFNLIKDAEVSKMVGLHKATKELFLYLDADIEIVGRDWLNKLVMPFAENFDLVGSFPRFIPKTTDTAIGRYLRYHPLELDPVFQFFCTEIKDTIIEDRGKYKICKFCPPKIPPIGICVYRRGILMEVIGDMGKFMDIDVPVILSKNGFNKFAYVSSCGIYHINVKNLKDLIQKRLRNIDKVYLLSIETREFKYFDLRKKRDILKIVFWIFYANLFFPSFIKGVFKTFKHKDFALLYEPIVSIALTDAIIWGFLRNKKGREIITRNLKLLLSHF